MAKHRFTIFTPVYNRKHTIHRVWDSLNKQTFKDFEWLIVDDGSQDNIGPVLEKYKNNANFPVRIFYQENGGKHIAFNKAIDEADGELIVPADSDDSFISTTLEDFNRHWEKYQAEAVAGISVLCMDEAGSTVGEQYPFEGLSNYLDMVYKYKVKGEKWGFARTDILRKYKFPNIPGGYFQESYLWAQIALNYQTAFLNIPLRIYHQDAGNQIIRNKKLSESTLNIKCFYYVWWINTILPAVGKMMSLKGVLKQYALVWKFAILAGKAPFKVIGELKRTRDKFIATFLFLPSYLLFGIAGRNK